ncbi:antitoxin Xre/MbcA/ParS toxin-binding domain-containing protein [Pseudomonas sp. TAF7]|uniref:antitoxin Xre/MbcA/ParS toxin-binding domain-containing protein n=1 Tax=Pseudomonas sp. TAF7 TaxID=3233073 RepID=UPI003F9CD65B
MRNINGSVYRARLETLLMIPMDASDQEVLTLIEAGFTSGRVYLLFERGIISATVRDQIVPFRTLKRRLAQGSRLTTLESDRLFRFVRIIAIAEEVFGDQQKAKRWLSTSKSRFSGRRPFTMLCTLPGSHLVEETLLQAAEGFTF